MSGRIVRLRCTLKLHNHLISQHVLVPIFVVVVVQVGQTNWRNKDGIGPAKRHRHQLHEHHQKRIHEKHIAPRYEANDAFVNETGVWVQQGVDRHDKKHPKRYAMRAALSVATCI